MKCILSLLLSVLLVISSCVPLHTVTRSYIRNDYGSLPRHGQTRFGDMILTYPDPKAIMEALDKALYNLGDAGEGESVSVYEAQLAAYDQLVSATSLAYVRHCQDVTDEQRTAEYGLLNSALYPLHHKLILLEKALMDRWGYHQELGTAYAEALDRLSLQNSGGIRFLRDQEDELCRRYERMDEEYRLTYRGRAWSMADLMADEDLSLREFLEALELYQQGKNQAAGEIFIELMSIRKQMAKESGYPSYAACQYDAYGREYTPEQAMQAAQVVKTVFVPLYHNLRERCENDLKYLSGATFREDLFIAAMEPATERVMPRAGEAWRYMLAFGLYDSQPSERKLNSSFTTYLANYRCPYIFTQWTDDASSVFTVIHEFGHFLSYYLNPEGTYYGSENLDLAELDAQGFELLMLSEYEAIFGRYAAAARLCLLTNAIYAILSGFMEDEFQQLAYKLQDPSVEALNHLYGQLAKEYGFDRLFGYEGREWTEISHTFQFPFYYISYGISMLGAMTLTKEGGKAYRKVVKRRAGIGFSEVTGWDVLSEDVIRGTAVWLENAVDSCMIG